jgi:hypothetical protein
VETFDLEYCDPVEERQDDTPVSQPARILIEHPFRDKTWLLVRKMPEPGFLVSETSLNHSSFRVTGEFSSLDILANSSTSCSRLIPPFRPAKQAVSTLQI